MDIRQLHFTKSNVICFKPRFSVIEILQNFVEVFICIGYSDILNKLETIGYSLCFKKKTLEHLLHLSFSWF